MPGGIVGKNLPDRCVVDLERGSVVRAVARIRATPELNQDLTRHIADIDQKLRALQGNQRAASELRAQLKSLD